MKVAVTLIALGVGFCMVLGCNRSPAPGPTQAAGNRTGASQSLNDSGPQRIESKYLPNAYRLHDQVLSGGQPDGEGGYRELMDLGVKTVISVDGARPKVELARQFGLRYVHMPHGYDGISETRSLELAKAVRDLPGPIYIHCHHGKHRSPAAATVACIGAGLLDPKNAVAILKIAGTSKNYRGLYQSVESSRRIDDKLLDEMGIEFPEVVALPPTAEAMVNIEKIYDRLKRFSAASWLPLADHPDLNVAHEALLLREQFTELLRTDEVQREPAEFQNSLKEMAMAAELLESLLEEWKSDSQTDRPQADDLFEQITQNCSACHRQFRDVPLREKPHH